MWRAARQIAVETALAGYLLLGALVAIAFAEDEPTPPAASPAASAAEAADAVAEASAADVVPEAVPAPAPAVPAAPAAAPRDEARGPGPRVDGFLDVRYRVHFTDDLTRDESDQDLYTTLHVRGRGGRHVSFGFLGSLDADIDGSSRVDLFGDLGNTWSENVHGYLYKAYVDIERYGILRRARIGRQVLDAEFLPVRFDGVLAEIQRHRLGFEAYAGVPAHLAEEAPRGDWAAGAAAYYRLPWLALRLDYVHVTDRRAASDRRDDDLVQLSATWLALDAVRVSGRAATFEGRSQFVAAAVALRHDPLDLSATLSAESRLGSWRDFSVEFSPLDEVIGRLEDYWQVAATVTKGFGEHVSLSAGAQVRRLVDLGDEGPFNHEFQRYFATAVVRDLGGCRDLAISGTGGLYVDGGDHLLDLGLDVSKKVAWRGDWTFRVGTAYLLYEVTPLTLDERERVRVAYGRVEWTPEVLESGPFWDEAPFRLHLGYRVEWDDEETYHVFDVGVRFAF